MEHLDELGIRKRCKNCAKEFNCRGTSAEYQCSRRDHSAFVPSAAAIKIRCAQLILERDAAREKLRLMEGRLIELARAHSKRIKECKKLWTKTLRKGETQSE